MVSLDIHLGFFYLNLPLVFSLLSLCSIYSMPIYKFMQHGSTCLVFLLLICSMETSRFSNKSRYSFSKREKEILGMDDDYGVSSVYYARVARPLFSNFTNREYNSFWIYKCFLWSIHCFRNIRNKRRIELV